MKKIDRYLGCLLGLAVGDALGYQVEFDSSPDVKDMSYDGLYSDDTQMSLATAYGLLDAKNSDRDPVDAVYDHYRDWLDTQSLPSESRAPGNTCLTALRLGDWRDYKKGSPNNPLNNSKGCGGVMRVAPVGLYAKSGKEAFDLAVECAALTHGHPTGYLTAGYLAEVVYHLVNGVSLENAVEKPKENLKRYVQHGETLNAVNKAQRLAMSQGVTVEQGVRSCGRGWIAEECLAVALYCALKLQDNPQRALLASVNHSGDSDSTGCVTGALLGTLLGVDALPKDWTDRVENHDGLVGVAEALYD